MDAAPPDAFEEIEFTSHDGLRLYGRRYRARGRAHPRRPLLCLAGLTRNSRDFHDVARALAADARAPRDVYTLDCRGRGRSQFDPDWRNYILPIEMLDVQDYMTLTGLAGPAILGTSRGGLITMLLAAAQPTRLGPVVLNDIGPVIEHEGLVRIAGYVGRILLPETWEAATRQVARLASHGFPNVPESHWAEVARQWFNEREGRPAPGYDPALGRTFAPVTDGPAPSLWPQFEALGHVACLVIRGETSDLLSAGTVAEMQRRHPRCEAHTVPGQGHAPLLKDAETIGVIARFLAVCDAG